MTHLRAIISKDKKTAVIHWCDHSFWLYHSEGRVEDLVIFFTIGYDSIESFFRLEGDTQIIEEAA